MSLMLNALKRIEAKQAVEPVPFDGVANLEVVANLVESALGATSRAPANANLASEMPLPISRIAPIAEETPSETVTFEPHFFKPDDFSPVAAEPIANDDRVVSNAVTLDAMMDQLHTYVAEAGLLYEMQPEFAEAEVAEAAQEFAAPLPVAVALPPVAVAETKAVQSAPTIRENPYVVAVPESTSRATSRATPPANDPYAETAERIVSQLPTDRSQVILFTSAGSGHGTTSTLARMAPMLAEKVGGEVLVVDANDRNPNAARWLKASPQHRLEAIRAATRWKDAVLATSHARVSLLPGNTACLGLNTSDGSGRMQSVLRELAGQYALVLVDAASLTECGTAELAAACDGAYLVVRLGEKSPRMLREAVRVVANSGGRLLGCVAVDGEG